MAKYRVETDDGAIYEVETEDGDTQDTPSQQTPREPDLASTLYHGAIEGGAMTVGGAAGAVIGSPAGPVGAGLGAAGLAAAMYPPAKRAAEAIDRWRGIQTPAQANPAVEFGQGLAIEATGSALKPIASVAKKMLPSAKVGEALSGTPASNLKRAYNQGFKKTYIDPMSKSSAGEAFGIEKQKVMSDLLTPEDQAAMLINPRGEANAKVSEVYTKFLKNEPIEASDAIAAKQAIDTVFPPDTARNASRIAKFSEFKKNLDEIIGEAAPEFQKASKDYAASKLRSDLLKPIRVNKSNPDKYSKLGAMMGGLATAGGAMSGAMLPAAAYAIGTSPLAMGVTSSVAGSIAKSGTANVLSDVTRRALLSEFISRITTKQEGR